MRGLYGAAAAYVVRGLRIGLVRVEVGVRGGSGCARSRADDGSAAAGSAGRGDPQGQTSFWTAGRRAGGELLRSRTGRLLAAPLLGESRHRQRGGGLGEH